MGAVYSDDDGDNSGSAYIYQLFEEESEPNITIAPASLAFDPIVIGESADLPLTISNTGDADLIVSDVSTDAPFSAVFDGEFTLAPGANREVAVTFAPEERGEFDGELSITSNDPDHQSLSMCHPTAALSIDRLKLSSLWLTRILTKTSNRSRLLILTTSSSMPTVMP